ncbi:hypothetical protein BD779DRAFT_1674049 [Infundibulicybe gibba]|nr:hypothetical protein BD779DRAFT_1674049 [Infundibulicybe gibba]
MKTRPFNTNHDSTFNNGTTTPSNTTEHSDPMAFSGIIDYRLVSKTYFDESSRYLTAYLAQEVPDSRSRLAIPPPEFSWEVYVEYVLITSGVIQLNVTFK